MKVRELGQNPISPDKPAGDDAHYEPEFEELQQEIDKLSIASASGESTDWKKVASLCVTILSDKSKDLLVAVYLATALTKLHGFEGFSVALVFIKDMTENFWETMFPPKRRMRGRMNAITWWQERTETFLKEQHDAPPLPSDQVETAKKNLDALDKALADKYEDAPSMRGLMTYLNMVPQQEATPEPAPEPTPPPETASQDTQSQPETAPQPKPSTPAQAPAQPAPQPAPQPVAGTKDKQSADSTLSTLLNQLLSVADFYLQNAPTNPLSYRLRRMWAWMPLAAPPPADNGKTRIPPPESIVKPSLEQLVNAGNLDAALRSAESRVTEHRFWLDISRITATALDSLGAAYRNAYDAVCAETLLLTQRLQGIENLAFSDGTPFADTETRAWLQSLSLGGADGPQSGDGDAESAAVSQAFSDARALLKDKRHLDAVELMQKGLESAASGQGRLLWRMALARVLLLAGKPELAAPLNEQNLSDVTIHGLEIFSPGLALDVLTLTHECCKLFDDEKNKSQAQEILARIVRLQPAQAMKILGAR